MYAYIESATGIVWAASTNSFEVSEIAADTGFPVDVRRDDAPVSVETKGAGVDYFHVWDGSEYVITWDLDKLKMEKNNQIDARTREIIADGITYDGRLFSLSIYDQSSWHARFNAAIAGVAVYPMKIVDKQSEPYYLADQAAVFNMYFTGFATVEGIQEGGRALKDQVNAATTKAEIDAVVDDR